ncbi:MAG TPA: hypothetical protein VFJ29_05540, partial [Candidatus Kapabacteria bacterium]|nr:hypothetical protein [Candidatus Kapabacteria bacterium]
MFNKLSFRWKLTLWYSGIVAGALLLFSWLLYVSVKQSLYNNLDISLKQDAEFIHKTLQAKNPKHKLLPKLKRREQRKLKERLTKDNNKIAASSQFDQSPEDTTTLETPEEKQADTIWADVYRHVLLNPKTNFVQVKNEAGEVVYHSDNVDSLAYSPPPDGMSLTEVNMDGKRLRVAILNATDMDIAVAYPISDIQTILNQLFSMLLYLLPAVLIVSVGGGWMLARASLQPI